MSDVGFSATGSASFGDDDGVRTVVASVIASDAEHGFDDTITFSMRRAADADASTLSGTYRLQFSRSPSGNGEPSTADFKLTIQRDGTGTSDETTERTPDGTAMATISSGSVLLSPEGRLHIGAAYLPMIESPLGGPLALIGTVKATNGRVSANGETFVGGISPDLHIGSWSAERLP